MQTDGVQVAFDLILEEIGSASNELKEEAKRLIDKDSHEGVVSIMDTAKKLIKFQLKVKGLQTEWLHSFDSVTRSKTQFDVGQQDLEVKEPLVLAMSYVGAVAEADFFGNNKIRLTVGSTVRKEVFESLPDHIREMRDSSLKDGSLVSKNSDYLEVRKPILFSSTSAAACFVAGCSVSGPREWHIKGKRTSFRQWQAKIKSAK